MSEIVPNKVDVLLATYNGGAYIYDFIKSLSCQSVLDFRVIVSDDGSDDGSLHLTKKYCEEFSLECEDISPKQPFKSSKKNFEHLLSSSTSQFVMLADQDDVWKPNKIEDTISRLSLLEKEVEGGPCMVFTDLEVVDQDLNPLNPSMMRHQALDPKLVESPIQILCQNVVAGCTIGLNREAVGLVLPFTKEAFVHDHWIALKVSLYGRIVYIDKATLLYRQHANNQVGFKKIGITYFLRKISHVLRFLKITKNVAGEVGLKSSAAKLLLTKMSMILKRMRY